MTAGGGEGNDLGGRQRSELEDGREREPEEVEPVVAGGGGAVGGRLASARGGRRCRDAELAVASVGLGNGRERERA